MNFTMMHKSTNIKHTYMSLAFFSDCFTLEDGTHMLSNVGNKLPIYAA